MPIGYFPRKEKPFVKLLKRFAVIALIAGVIFLMFWQLPPKPEQINKDIEDLKPVSVDAR